MNTSCNSIKPTDERLQPREELSQARGAVHGQTGVVAPAERERLQHPGEPEEMVGVKVREEDLLEVGQPGGRALQLPLRSLRAVEEQLVAASPNEERRRSPLGRGHRAGSAEKHDVQIHGSILGLARSSSPVSRPIPGQRANVFGCGYSVPTG